MKLTGAAITNNYENSIQKKDLRTINQLKKETSTSETSIIPSSNVSKFESIGIANQEKSKYYQTQVSLLQKGEKSLNEVDNKLNQVNEIKNQNLSDIEKNIKIQEIIKGIETLTKGEDFQKNEILSNLNIHSLGLDGYISSAEKEKILNEARLQTRIKANELNIIKQGNENELTKLRLANENFKAANSKTIDKSNIGESLNEVKHGLENKSVELNGNLSQTRVMNILNS